MDTKSLFETIESAVKSIAIIATGIWALFTFVIKDLPNYSDKLASRLDPILQYVDDQTCLLKISVGVRNNGNTSISVSGLDLKFWEYGRKRDADPVQFLDTAEVRKTKEMWYLPPHSDDYFAISYDPQEQVTFSYTLFVPNSPQVNYLFYLKLLSNSSAIVQENFAQRTIPGGCGVREPVLVEAVETPLK
jgi:hypothetical protein